MTEALTMWGEVASAWAQPVGVGLVSVLCYLVHDIKNNHLVHIYDVLEELAQRPVPKRVRRKTKEG